MTDAATRDRAPDSPFPALLVLLALLGLAGQSTIDTLLQNLGSITPSATREVVTNAVRDLQSSNQAAGVAFVAGLAGALWSASGYVGGFMKAPPPRRRPSASSR